MKDQFTLSLRKTGNHLALTLAALLLFVLNPLVSQGQNTVDIGLFNSANPNEVEVRIKPDFNSTSNLTNMIFTIRWETAAGVTVTPGSPAWPYLISPQTGGTDGIYTYQTFGSAAGQPVSWVAGNEYVAFTFTYNTCTAFELVDNNDAWAIANNGLYYVEMFSAQLDHTGTIYESPLVCLSPVPANAINPVPADGAQMVAYNASDQIDLGWDYVSDPLFADPDSFLVSVTLSWGGQSFFVPYVSGQTTYANAIQISPGKYTNVDWSVTPFNANGNAVNVETWSFLTAPTPLDVDAMAQGPTTICLGDTTQLLADPSGGVYPMSFAWSPSGSLDNDTIMNPIAFPSQTTTYTVTVTDQVGQTATDEVTITVNIPNVHFSSDDTLCVGECATLSVSGASTFNWSTGASDSFITVCPPTDTTIMYTVSVMDANDCVLEHTFIVTVNPLPGSTISDWPDFCVTDPFYDLDMFGYGDPAGGVYSGPGISGLEFHPQVAGAGVHTITYTYTDGNGCTDSASLDVTVFGLPNLSFPNMAGVCVDAAPFALTAASPAGGDYSGAGVSNNMFDPAMAGLGIHTIHYSYLDPNTMCGAMDSATIEVFALPVADAGMDVTICEGECTDLTATGGDYYMWNTQETTASINVCPVATTSYTVVVTDMNGCQVSADVTVNVNPAPVADAGNDVSICFGQCTDLQASGGASYEWGNGATTVMINVCPTSTQTYVVTVSDTNNCTATASVTVTVIPAISADFPDLGGYCLDEASFALTSATPVGGVYSGPGVSNNMFDPAAAGVGVHTLYYYYVDSVGCAGQDSAMVEVFALPVADAGMDVTICEGECTDLTATGGDYYMWNTQETTASINVCPVTTTSYTVVVTDMNGCQASADVTVNVNPLPMADAGNDVSICDGDCATLTATGGVSYLWSDGQTTASINVCPTSTTTYTVTVTDANGCENTDEVTVTVNPLPVASAGPDAYICLGDCATLTASGGVDYLWSTGDTTQDITVCPTDSTLYSVTVTDANGCEAADEVEVIVNPAAIIGAQPADVAVDLGSPASFMIAATGASYYQWQVSSDNGTSWTNVVDGPIYTGAATAMLNIPVTNQNMNGLMFRVELGSPCGPSVVSTTASLTIVVPPITATIPQITSCADEVIVPIIVVKTLGVGAISLTLNYDANVLIYDSYQNLHPSLLNGFLTVVNPSANSVYFSWHSVSPLNILYDTLVELVFTSPNGGTTAMNWDLATPGNCEFSDVAANVIPASFFAGTVTAIPSPAITMQPVDVDITEGQNASFSVTATNATDYQWEVSDDGGASWSYLTDGAIYQGSQTASLNIFGATVYMDDFQFRCIVGGPCPPYVTSDEAMLNVRPIITTTIGQHTRCADEILIPITVSHMYGVAGVSLTLGFNTVVLNYAGVDSKHPAIDGVGTFYDNSTFGKVYLSWFSTNPVDIGDDTLVVLRFTSPGGGTSNLVWDLSVIDNCQYNNLASEIIASVWENGVVHVQPTPLVYTVTGGGEYCDGGNGVVIGLNGSQNGRVYQLYLDGVYTGQTINGTGSAISFGAQTDGGNYTVIALNPQSGCTSDMIGSADVIVNPLPVADAGADVSILLGTTVDLNGSATGGTPGYTYMWTPGGATTATVNVGPAATTTYTLGVTDSKGCYDSDDVLLTVYANTISGVVTYDNAAQSPLSNVDVYLNDDSKTLVASATTDANGAYTFPPVPNGTYTITAATNKPWGGVNSTDALVIMQHFILLDTLEGLRLAAADVDATGYVNTTDAFNVAQRFAQLITSFVSGDWIFEESLVTLNEDNFVSVDFLGLCYGDVNGSHIPAAKASTTLSLTEKAAIPFAAGKEVWLPVSVEQAVQMGALSLVMDIPAGISVKDVKTAFGDALSWNINDGLRISWYNTNAVSLNAGEEMIRILVAVDASFRGEASFSLGDESEMAGAFAEVLAYTELSMPKIAAGMVSNELSLRNYPNPFKGSTTISYTLPEDGNASLKVYNILGEEVAALVNGYQSRGQYNIQFNATNLSPGIYQYRLELSGKQEMVITKPMIITE